MKKDWTKPPVWKRLNKDRISRLYGNALFRAKSCKLERISNGHFDTEPNLYNIATFHDVDYDILTTLYYSWLDTLAERISNGKRIADSSPKFGKKYGQPYGE